MLLCLPDNQTASSSKADPSYHSHLKCHEHCSAGRKEVLKVASTCSQQRSMPMLSPPHPGRTQIVAKARAEEDNWAWPYHQVPGGQLRVAKCPSRKFKEQASNWWDSCGSVETNIFSYKQCFTLLVFTVKAAELKLLSRAILYFHQSCCLPLQYLVHYCFYHRNFPSEQSNQRFLYNKGSTYRSFPQSYYDSLVLTHICEHCSYNIRYGLKTRKRIDLWYITYIITRWG